jgi:hypothetical protein
VVDIADSPVAPRTTVIQPNGLLATGSTRVRNILGGGVVDSDSDSDDDLPLSLAFLSAPKVDKGKRRAMDMSEGVTGELAVFPK